MKPRSASDSHLCFAHSNHRAFAQAIYALDNGEVYEAYEFYLAAQLYNPAHDLAVLELAPDAIVRGDLVLLKDLFERFNARKVDNWNLRGKV